ncbi:Transposase-like protein [Archaeoglobus sulfaticallidus PM70-1]|uniref:Transposase-like protein n=1 Tax=Archaeoglobus sulfaticallidus PM70-1 TaxID=387631 RepID=N0BNG4_9EURY|nr:RNA-guided endonuclease TnpB family protein [Archaeoglobus sulfaticallidus]AGK62196.1 Transposase-like protein [Archaeoglobus sulfaticallidus PM70-1]
MRRTNVFKLKPTKEQEKRLFELANNCSRLWNEINYKRRQSFFSGEIDWNTDEEYHKYKKIIGSAMVQQIIRKNNEAWKSFFALLKKKSKGKLPPNIRKVSPPRYWKDRKAGKRKLRILVRNDCYKLGGDVLKFGKMRIKWKGKNRWKGKQGRLEIVYDEPSKSWYAFQPVEVEPLHQPIGYKKAYCDLGVRVLIMAAIDNEVFGYSSNRLLSDWWYWSKKIAKYQSKLKRVNNKHTSKRLRQLYRKRKRRFRHFVNTIVNRFIRLCYERGVSEIVIGDLKGIRNNNNGIKKFNSMIHNFWSHDYLIQRIKEKAEEYGMKVTQVDESYTSSRCPRCGSVKVYKHKRLFKCLNCGLEAHRDAVGCVNIGVAQGNNPGELINGAVACPVFLRVEEGAEVKADVAPMSVKLSEARTSHALA